MTFTGCILCRKGEESFFFLLGFAIATSMRVAPFLSSQLCLIEFLETEYNFDPEESIPSSPIFLSIPFCLPQLDYYVLLSHLDYKCVHIHIPSRVILWIISQLCKILHPSILSQFISWIIESIANYVRCCFSSGGTGNFASCTPTPMPDSPTPAHLSDGAGMSHSKECDPGFLQGKLITSTLMLSHMTSSLTVIVLTHLSHNLTFPLVTNPLSLGCLSFLWMHAQLQVWRHLHRTLWSFVGTQYLHLCHGILTDHKDQALCSFPWLSVSKMSET